VSENPFYKDAQTIGEIALEMYNNKTASQIHLGYTEYHTMLSLVPKSVRLLPLDLELEEAAGVEDESVYDTDAGELLEYAASAYVHSRIFGAMLESAVCEQCARLTGMDSAVKNSEKMIDTMTLKYNQMRQSAITQEIAEIVGGANAVEKK
jgi:F-type H+-transporting ATPase subunit gamma